jgi:enoyl-CoA hydratase/carnithine racemase
MKALRNRRADTHRHFFEEMRVEQPHVLTDQKESIFVVTLNRPAKLNAMSSQMHKLLSEAVAKFRDDNSLKVMLIRATGRYFCAGADITGEGMPDFGTNTSQILKYYRSEMGGQQRTWDEIEAVEKPVVAAHHAPCVGGGLEMSLSCDFRLAAKSAHYSFPEAKLGCLPASGGLSRLTRIAGPHWARWMILADQAVSAEQAVTMGLVHAVYPDDEFESRVWQFCRHLASQPREMMAMTKLAIELAADVQAAQARNIERLANSVLVSGSEHEQMLNAVRKHIARSSA